MLKKLFIFCLIIINCVTASKTNKPKQQTQEEKIEALFWGIKPTQDNSEDGNSVIFNSIRARLDIKKASIESEKWSCKNINWEDCAKKWELVFQSQAARKNIDRLWQQVQNIDQRKALLELDMYLQSQNYSDEKKVEFLENLLKKNFKNNQNDLEEEYKNSVCEFATKENRRKWQESFSRKR